MGATLHVDNCEVDQIRVDCESDLLIELLQKLSIDHYSIRDDSVFKDIEIKKILPYFSESPKWKSFTWISQ